MLKPEDYINQNLGKGYDEDKAYGVQCVDGFKHFCKNVLGFNVSKSTICSPTNLATSIWDNFESCDFDKYFDKVPSNQMAEGDWTIWSKGSTDCPDSHIAMFIKDNKNGTGQFFGQNQYGIRAYTKRNLKYNGCRGAFRPKIYHQDSNKINNSINVADQILYKNSKVCLGGTQIQDIKTKGSLTTFYSEKYGCWLPITPFYRINEKGERYSNQKSSKGNWINSDVVFTVQSVSKNPDRAIISIDGANYNVLSSGLYEVSNS